MRLTTFTDYSLRVLIYLAAQPGGRARIADVARTYGISEHHLTKVVHFLGKAGFLANVRGRGGGVQLGRGAEAINVGAVVRAAEGEAVPAECFDASSPMCAISNVCRLRGVLQEAVQAFYGVLDRYSLADLVRNRETLNTILFPALRHHAAAPIAESSS